jgi:hypothetical protein
MSSAGEVVLDTDSSVAVIRDGATIARATGAGRLSLGEFPAGPHRLEFKQKTGNTVGATIDVPQSGGLILRLDAGALYTALGSHALTERPPPLVVLRPASDQQFTVVINRRKRVEVTQETQIPDLGAGRHAIEVRSLDNLTIWSKGHLHLEPGATIVLDLAAGRAVKAIGHEDFWTHAGQPEREDR